MKTIITLISCLFIISGCQLWFANLSTASLNYNGDETEIYIKYYYKF
jgi:hypothetical protein